MSTTRILGRSELFNSALPVADTDLLAAGILPVIYGPGHLELNVCMSVSGVLYVRRTVGGVTVRENLNDGVALAANSLYGFHIAWRAGDTINLRYTVTGGTILSLRLDEVLEAC